MHTDEYEISLAREINICKRVVEELQMTHATLRQRFGMDFAPAARAVAEGRLDMDNSLLADWQETVEALPRWEQRLKEYQEALRTMRISASSF